MTAITICAMVVGVVVMGLSLSISWGAWALAAIAWMAGIVYGLSWDRE